MTRSLSVTMTGPLQGCLDLAPGEARSFHQVLDHTRLAAKTFQPRALSCFASFAGHSWLIDGHDASSVARLELDAIATLRKKRYFYLRESCVTFERRPGFWVASAPPFPGVMGHEEWKLKT